jgi:hypothetical protein
MTDDEARALATRIIDTWPTGPKAYIWRDALRPLDYGTAGTAYVRLRKLVTTGAPTPGRFEDEYRALHTPATDPTPTAVCQTCDGSNWVECTDDRRHARYTHNWDTCGCHAVIPCGECGRERPHKARGMCTACYERTRRTQ